MAGLGAATIGVARQTDYLDGRLHVELDGQSLDINAYNPVKLLGANCALRACEIAEHHFGKHYEPSAAWDRKYLDVVVARGDDLALEALISQDVVTPGMLVGMYNPKSSYLDGVDMNGQQRAFTHIVVYLGKKDGNALFAHQYGPEISVVTENGLRALGLTSKYVFDTPISASH